MSSLRNGMTGVAAALLIILVFSTAAARAAGPIIPVGFFFENPYSITGVTANIEIVDLDNPPDGALIMNKYRVDINLYDNMFGIYAIFPFAGVVNFGPADNDDYDFGNIGIGGKMVLIHAESLVVTTGVEFAIPTAGNGFGAVAANAYFKDLPYFLDDAFTVTPYLVIGTGRDWWALQGSVAAEIITNADDIEGDNTELRLKYGATASVTPELSLPFSTSFIVEGMFISTTSFDDNGTEIYITPGIRLGGQVISVGGGVQIPVGEEVDDFANANYFIDVIFRFGS